MRTVEPAVVPSPDATAWEAPSAAERLAVLPNAKPMDIVDALRKHDDLPGVLAEAVAAGLTVVMDRCVKIEHARFHGAPISPVSTLA